MIGRSRPLLRVPDVADRVAVVAIAFAAIARLVQSATLAGVGPPAQALSETLELDAAIAGILGRGHVHGWSPVFALGRDLFADAPPGLAIVLAALRLPTFGKLSTTAALEATLAIAACATPLLAAALARSLRCRWSATAVVAAVATAMDLSLVPTSAAPGPASAAALPLALAALAAAVRLVDDEAVGHRRWWLVVAGTTAATVLLHPPTAAAVAVAAVVGGPLVASGWRLPGRAALPVVRGAALGVALAAPWWLPALVHDSAPRPGAAHASSDLGGHLLSAAAGDDAMAGPAVVVALVAGWLAAAVVVARGGRRRDLAQVLAPAVVVAVVVVAGAAAAGRTGAAGAVAAPGLQATGVLLVLAAVPGAVALARLPRPAAVALATIAIGAGVAVGAGAADGPPHPPAVDLVAADVREAVVPGTRAAVSDAARAAGVDPLSLADATDRPTLAPVATRTAGDPARAADRLSRVGVTALVAAADEAVTLEASGRFRAAGDSGVAPVRVLRPVPGDTQPDAASLVTVTEGTAEAALRRHDPEHLVLDVLTSVPTPATLPVAWSDRWRATIEGRGVRVGRTRDGLVRLDLPIGQSRVQLDYDRGRADALGVLVAVAAAVAAAARAAATRLGYGRRRPSSSSSVESSSSSSPSRMP